MDVLSVAEIRKRFNDKQVMGLRPLKTPVVQPEPSLDSSTPEKSEQPKSIGSNQSFDDANSTTLESVSSSAQTVNETASTHNEKLARILHQGVHASPYPRKPPAPLPNSDNRHRNNDVQSEISTIVQGPATHPVNAESPHHFIGLKKAPVPLPASANRNRSEDPHSESSIINQDPISHPVGSQSGNNFTRATKAPVPLPNSTQEDHDEQSSTTSHSSMPHPVMSHGANGSTSLKKPPALPPIFINRDRTDSDNSECLSVCLDTTLSSKCMFFDSERMINDYQRRDPRTIIYPKMKPTMPKITANEIDMFDTYSNT